MAKGRIVNKKISSGMRFSGKKFAIGEFCAIMHDRTPFPKGPDMEEQ